MARKKYLTEEEIIVLIDDRLKAVNELIESLHPPEGPPPETEMYQEQVYYAVEPDELRDASEEDLVSDLREEKPKKETGFWSWLMRG